MSSSKGRLQQDKQASMERLCSPSMRPLLLFFLFIALGRHVAAQVDYRKFVIPPGSGGPPGDAGTKGWFVVLSKDIGLSPMSAALTQSDTILYLDRSDSQGRTLKAKDGSTSYTQEMDIFTGQSRPLALKTNTFCAAGAHMPDGRIVANGGFGEYGSPSGGLRSMRYFRPSGLNGTTEWVEVPAGQKENRWYPTTILLSDKRLITIGGLYEVAPIRSFEYPLAGPNGPSYRMPFLNSVGGYGLYPIVHLLPNNQLFILIGARGIMFDHNANRGAGAVTQTFPDSPDGCGKTYAGAAATSMLPLKWNDNYQFVDIVFAGGGPPGCGNKDCIACTKITRLSDVIGSTGGDPVWTIEDQPKPRIMGEAVLDAMGKIIIVNGAERGLQGYENAKVPVKEAWLYEDEAPIGSRVKVLAASQFSRGYHSVATTDSLGRVVIAGSNARTYYYPSPGIRTPYGYQADFPTHTNVDVLLPPYIFLRNRPDNLTVYNRVGNGRRRSLLEKSETKVSSGIRYFAREVLPPRSEDFLTTGGGWFHHINIGGPRFTDKTGALWEEEILPPYGSTVIRSTAYVAGDNEWRSRMFRTARVGKSLVFKLPVRGPNPHYTVFLYFAEFQHTEPGKRVFNIYFQESQTPAMKNLDLVASAQGHSPRVAIVHKFDVQASTSMMVIELRALVGEALLSGVAIRAEAPRKAMQAAQSPPYQENSVPDKTSDRPLLEGRKLAEGDIRPGQLLVAINSGGRAFTDGAGMQWTADQYFAGTSNVGSGVVNPVGASQGQGPLFAQSRAGANFQYYIPVPQAGTYRVTLYFAEPFYTRPRGRVFKIAYSIYQYSARIMLDEGFDIFAWAGARGKVVTRTFNIVVPQPRRRLTLHFLQGSADSPQVSGLSVTVVSFSRGGGGGNTNPPIVPPIPGSGNMYLKGSLLNYNQQFVVDFVIPGLEAFMIPMVEVNLHKPAFSTHSYSMNLRYLKLRVTGILKRPGGGVRVFTVTPPDSKVCPGGFYLLWVIHVRADGTKVPCVKAAWVQFN